MSRRGSAADRPQRLRAKAARLVEAALEAPGATSADDRRAAFVGRADDAALSRYLDAVHRHAHRITDEDVQRLRDGGLGDDAIFELTLAAALGAGDERLQAGLSLLSRSRP
jgi:alkylhydroperoxidase family enzyme